MHRVTWSFEPDGDDAIYDAELESHACDEETAKKVGFIHFCLMLACSGAPHPHFRWPHQ